MDPWQIFANMCKIVVEEQNVFLNVIIHNGCVEMRLFPYNSEDWEYTEDDTDY